MIANTGQDEYVGGVAIGVVIFFGLKRLCRGLGLTLLVSSTLVRQMPICWCDGRQCKQQPNRPSKVEIKRRED